MHGICESSCTCKFSALCWGPGKPFRPRPAAAEAGGPGRAGIPFPLACDSLAPLARELPCAVYGAH